MYGCEISIYMFAWRGRGRIKLDGGWVHIAVLSKILFVKKLIFQHLNQHIIGSTGIVYLQFKTFVFFLEVELRIQNIANGRWRHSARVGSANSDSRY